MRSMEDVCGGNQPFLATASLKKEHSTSMDKALTFFQNKRKMGGQEFSQMYMEKLMKVRKYLIELFIKRNLYTRYFRNKLSIVEEI